MDSTGFGFIIMLKGCKEFISQQVRKQKGTFENNWGNQIAEFGVYGEPNLQVIRDELDLSQLISREKNPESREALEDLDEFMNGY